MDAAALLYVIVLPLVVSAAVAFAMCQLRVSPRTTWAIAVAFGYLAGQLGLKSRAGLKHAVSSLIIPSEARDWLPMCVLLAAGVSILNSSAPAAWRRWTTALAVLLVVAAPLRLVACNARLAQDWSIPQKLACVALLAATLGLVWLLLEISQDDDAPVVRLILMTTVAVGSAVVITLSGTIVGGQLCGVLAGALLGTAFGSWLTVSATGSAGAIRGAAGSAGAFPPAPSTGLGGAAAVVTMSLGGLIVIASFFAELAPVVAAMLFLSLIAAAGPLPASVRSGPLWFQASIRAALCFFPLAIAIVRSLPT